MSARNRTPHPLRPARAAQAVAASTAVEFDDPPTRIRAEAAGTLALVLWADRDQTGDAGAVTFSVLAGDVLDVMMAKILSTSTAPSVVMWT